ncbi:hypothetical protein VTK26DRAFT_6405 [Humicola hyalothermophila]
MPWHNYVSNVRIFVYIGLNLALRGGALAFTETGFLNGYKLLLLFPSEVAQITFSSRLKTSHTYFYVPASCHRTVASTDDITIITMSSTKSFLIGRRSPSCFPALSPQSPHLLQNLYFATRSIKTGLANRSVTTQCPSATGSSSSTAFSLRLNVLILPYPISG